MSDSHKLWHMTIWRDDENRLNFIGPSSYTSDRDPFKGKSENVVYFEDDGTTYYFLRTEPEAIAFRDGMRVALTENGTTILQKEIKDELY